MKRISFFLVSLAGLSVLGTPWGTAAEKKEAPMAEGIQDDRLVKFDYTLTVDGAEVDSSQRHGPLQYVQGRSEIIPGLERQMMGLHVGDSKEVTVEPKEGYGQRDPSAFLEVPRSQLPQEPQPQVGMVLKGSDPSGRAFQGRIAEVKTDTVKLDMNHPLAGKTLHFRIKILEISPAPSPSTEN